MYRMHLDPFEKVKTHHRSIWVSFFLIRTHKAGRLLSPHTLSRIITSLSHLRVTGFTLHVQDRDSWASLHRRLLLSLLVFLYCQNEHSPDGRQVLPRFPLWVWQLAVYIQYRPPSKLSEGCLLHATLLHSDFQFSEVCLRKRLMLFFPRSETISPLDLKWRVIVGSNGFRMLLSEPMRTQFPQPDVVLYTQCRAPGRWTEIKPHNYELVDIPCRPGLLPVIPHRNLLADVFFYWKLT